MKQTPRIIDPAKTFDALVDWLAVLVYELNAPGFLIGLSGTDSLVAFCAAAKAMEKAGKANRIMGVHFAPSEDFLYDHPEAYGHLWFANEVVPWLKKKFPQTEIVINTEIDWRADGQRWGTLMDLSVVTNDKSRLMRLMRLPEEQYWVLGTRNCTEDKLKNYSNISMAASIQPLVNLWKSEILEISKYLEIPQIAIAKSCETDCICGRMRISAQHLVEVDQLLMARFKEIPYEYTEKNISEPLRTQLNNFINAQIMKNGFKKDIPILPLEDAIVREEYFTDSLVISFEDGTLNIKEFNHRKHLYIAWVYLKEMNLDAAVERYMRHLQPLLQGAGQSFRLSLSVTQAYFARLETAMKEHSAETFDELVEKSPAVLSKISA